MTNDEQCSADTGARLREAMAQLTGAIDDLKIAAYNAAAWRIEKAISLLNAAAPQSADSAPENHKWFDPECGQKGCQSLVWKSRYESAVKGRQEFRQAYRESRASVAQVPAVTNRMIEAGALALANSIWYPPKKLAELNIWFKQQARIVLEAALAPPQRVCMTNPRVTDNDNGEITVSLDGRELRGWGYIGDDERRTKMLAAREYVEGWCDGRDAR